MVRTSKNGKRLYSLASLNRKFGLDEKQVQETKKKHVIYARVSSSHQKEDLRRQIKDLKSEYPDHESVATLPPASTSKEKVFKPFWNKSALELSKQLWLPTKTDCVDSDSNYWNLSLKSLGQNSWFKVSQKQPRKPENLPTISLPSPQSLWHVTTENDRKKTRRKRKRLESEKKAKDNQSGSSQSKKNKIVS